ncbi:MAG: hypothetical protein E2P02_07600 [Acidobacteria bacterium]|nr:MAG: hypothetical protein E2P02_07600 [Acidobacteriota bacterium]
MVDINRRERYIRTKILYYGPAAGGKTTNLVVLHRLADKKRRGELVSVNLTQDRTILLDLLPVKTPAFGGYDLRFQVVAVPGQPVYAATRDMLLRGADSIVFVANSAADRWEETLSSFREMNENLLSQGLDPASIPVVFQFNKQDLPELTPLDAMERTLNSRHSDSFPAVAIREEGVVDTFAAALERTMADLTTRYKIGENFRNPRTVKEWARESMHVIFGWKPGSKAVTEHTKTSGITVRVPVDSYSSTSASTSSASAENQTGSLEQSYAEAAANLTMELGELREDRDKANRRCEEIGAVIDVAQKLLEGADTEHALRDAVVSIGGGIEADSGSLSLLRPNGSMETVVVYNLVVEPLLTTTSENGRELGRLVMEEGTPLLFASDETGPFVGSSGPRRKRLYGARRHPAEDPGEDPWASDFLSVRRRAFAE